MSAKNAMRKRPGMSDRRLSLVEPVSWLLTVACLQAKEAGRRGKTEEGKGREGSR